ncbi:MAG: DUF3108 domain-containing protein [Candidatus Omnitrophota bacterium]
MKKVFIITVVILILFLWVVYQNNTDPKAIISNLVQKGQIKTGDLKFKINFLNVFPMGEAVLNKETTEKYGNLDVYHLRATAYSQKAIERFFTAVASIDSYVNIGNNNPVLFRQLMKLSGKPEMNKEVIYDQKNGIMTILGVQRSILPNTQDPLSAIFNIRKMDLDKNREFEISINTNQKNYVLNGSATPKDLIIKNKTYKTYILKAEIKRRDKNPYHKSQITMVLLKEKENIPISVRVFASGVIVSAKLVEIK